MAKYIGSKCLACDKEFTENDDIVVCPECGTPYHRECYKENGRCINDSLHETGGSWAEENTRDNEEQINTRCPRCGFDNSADKLFCEKCGLPLISAENSMPFNEPNNDNGQGSFSGNAMPFSEQVVFDQNSEVDGVKLGDYAKYIGTNPLPMLAKFVRFGKFGGKISVNIFSFIFPHLYFFFRKMKGWGTLFLVLFSVLTIPYMITMFSSGYAGIKLSFGFDVEGKVFKTIAGCSVDLMLLLRIAAGLFANYLYYKKANKDIKNIRKNCTDDEEGSAAMEIAGKGGISWAGVIVAFTVYMVIVCGAMFGLTFIK